MGSIVLLLYKYFSGFLSFLDEPFVCAGHGDSAVLVNDFDRHSDAGATFLFK